MSRSKIIVLGIIICLFPFGCRRREVKSESKYFGHIYLPCSDKKYLDCKQIVDVEGERADVYEMSNPQVKAARIFSLNNQNTDYSLMLFFGENDLKTVKEEGWDSYFKYQNEYFPSSLVADATKISWIYYKLPKDKAIQIGKYFNIPIRHRKDPEYKLQANFIDIKDSYQLGEDIIIGFELVNRGNKKIIYYINKRWKFSKDRKSSRYDFQVYYEDNLVQNIDWSGGAWTGFNHLLPGETDIDKIKLKDWNKFTKPGKYIVQGTAKFRFFNASGEKILTGYDPYGPEKPELEIIVEELTWSNDSWDEEFTQKFIIDIVESE